MKPTEQIQAVNDLRRTPGWTQLLEPWLQAQVKNAYHEAVYASTPELREAARHNVISLEKVLAQPDAIMDGALDILNGKHEEQKPEKGPVPVQTVDAGSPMGGMPDIHTLGQELIAGFTQQLRSQLDGKEPSESAIPKL